MVNQVVRNLGCKACIQGLGLLVFREKNDLHQKCCGLTKLGPRNLIPYRGSERGSQRYGRGKVDLAASGEVFFLEVRTLETLVPRPTCQKHKCHFMREILLWVHNTFEKCCDPAHVSALLAIYVCIFYAHLHLFFPKPTNCSQKCARKNAPKQPHMLVVVCILGLDIRWYIKNIWVAFPEYITFENDVDFEYQWKEHLIYFWNDFDKIIENQSQNSLFQKWHLRVHGPIGAEGRPHFESMGLLVQKGARAGLTSALKVCLRYHCFVIEQLSQLARHTMRDEWEFRLLTPGALIWTIQSSREKSVPNQCP